MNAYVLKSCAAKAALFALAGVVSLVLAGCFYMPGVSGPNARAGLVLPRYIAGNTTSIVLIVGGPGMNTIYSSFPAGTTSASVSVPSGASRTFTVLANTPSVTFRDDVTVDLAPDETKEITLTPTLFATQIIVPDIYNFRLVQVSDMHGTGWKEQGAATQIYPKDVDFDAQGLIYVVDLYQDIWWADDITQTFEVLSGVIDPYNISSIAMDRARGLLYYVYASEGYYLRRIQVESGVDEEVNLGFLEVYLNTVEGIAVDPDGFVYIADASSCQILKINPNPDPSTPTLERIYSGGALSYPYDVLVNGDYIYVSDPGAAQIVRFDKNLSFVDSFTGPASDPLVGPQRFVAILNKPITVVDQVSYYDDTLLTEIYVDRIVSFGDMTGAGWTSYGSHGSDQDQFLFVEIPM